MKGCDADTDIARGWLDDGRTPNGASGRAFTEKSVHGFDLTFSAPKSVSVIRALTDDVAEKVLAAAHTTAVRAAMEYLHRHAGYTRVHNPVTGTKTCNDCRVWWRSPISTKRRGAVTRTCTPTSSCPTAKPAPTAHSCRSTASRSITKPKPPG